MDVGFDERTLVLNHVFFAGWTILYLPASDPLAVLDGGVGLGRSAVFALWAVAGLALLAIDCLVASRLLAGD
ncbi:hypothetical protein [Halorubellus sp. PRR65]|uniref:hypothetical protein n=1 Tax=Halorubellus sp. PRR65 TaxID=3098148 RepID=UPI002B2619CC|nr:hypothetical protein [Halorubellus sp. PRR65]